MSAPSRPTSSDTLNSADASPFTISRSQQTQDYGFLPPDTTTLSSLAPSRHARGAGSTVSISSSLGNSVMSVGGALDSAPQRTSITSGEITHNGLYPGHVQYATLTQQQSQPFCKVLPRAALVQAMRRPLLATRSYLRHATSHQ